MSLALVIIIAFFFYGLAARNLSLRLSRLLVVTFLAERGFPLVNLPSISQVSFSEIVQAAVGIYIALALFVNHIVVSKSAVNLFLIFFLFVIIGDLHLFISSPETKVLGFGVSLDELFYGTIQTEAAEFGGDHILRLIRIIAIFPFVLLFASRLLDFNEITRLAFIFSIFFVSITYLELILKLLNLNYIWSRLYDVFTGFDNVSIIGRGGVFGLQGFTFEPSHLAYLFIGLAVLLIPAGQRYSKLLLFLIIFILFVSGSLRNVGVSAFLGGVTVFYYYKINRLKKFKDYQYVLMALICFSGLSIYFIPADYLDYAWSRILAVFGLGDAVGSEAVRMNTWSYAWAAFWERPLFGIGLGSVSTHGGIPAALASVGILGIAAYIILVKRVFKIRFLFLPFLAFWVIALFSWNAEILYSPAVLFVLLAIGILQQSIDGLYQSKTSKPQVQHYEKTGGRY